MNIGLANEIELIVLSFFQERMGFRKWWNSLDDATRAAIEVNLIDRISDIEIQMDMKQETN